MTEIRAIANRIVMIEHSNIPDREKLTKKETLLQTLMREVEAEIMHTNNAMRFQTEEEIEDL